MIQALPCFGCFMSICQNRNKYLHKSRTASPVPCGKNNKIFQPESWSAALIIAHVTTATWVCYPHLPPPRRRWKTVRYSARRSTSGSKLVGAGVARRWNWRLNTQPLTSRGATGTKEIVLPYTVHEAGDIFCLDSGQVLSLPAKRIFSTNLMIKSESTELMFVSCKMCAWGTIEHVWHVIHFYIKYVNHYSTASFDFLWTCVIRFGIVEGPEELKSFRWCRMQEIARRSWLTDYTDTDCRR